MHTQRTIGLIVLAIVVALAATTAGLVWWFGPAVGFGVAAGGALSVVFLYVAVIGPWQLAEPGAFIMERKMLRTIKRRVESAPALVVAS